MTSSVERLTFIRRARDLGFSIQKIRTLLALDEPASGSCAQVREIAQAHLDDVRTKLADLKKLERILADTVALCSGVSAPTCPVLQMLGIASRRPHKVAS